jgi:hypothetical protein
MDGNSKRKLIVDVRKFSNAACPARPVYQHGHFCVRAFHLLLAYPGYSLLLCFIIYIQMMELRLYFNIRARGSFDFSSTTATDNQSVAIHIFDPLPVKKIMVEPIVSHSNGREQRVYSHFDRFITFARHWLNKLKPDYILRTTFPLSRRMPYPIFTVSYR